MSERVKGTVKWFNMYRGFGFITPDDRSEDVFFMFVANSAGRCPIINENEAVEFTVRAGDDGRTRAYDVTTPGGGSRLGDDRELPSYGGRGGYGGGGGRRCYTCGQKGHLFRDCPQGGGGRGGYRGRGGGGGRGCYKCGEKGHLFRDCPQGGGGGEWCYGAGGGDYGGGEWCYGAGGGGRRCYKCGEMGHIFRNCPQGGGRGCFSCGESGHIARDCINKY